ncbi:MAG: hypothetical protein IKZ05_06050, partial [Clostridia bacterium]|nr:hypothetical protein [Clostridia bacterium]
RSGRKNQAPTDAWIFSGTARWREAITRRSLPSSPQVCCRERAKTRAENQKKAWNITQADLLTTGADANNERFLFLF